MRPYMLTFLWAVIAANMIYILIVDTQDALISWGIALVILAPVVYYRRRKGLY